MSFREIEQINGSFSSLDGDYWQSSSPLKRRSPNKSSSNPKSPDQVYTQPSLDSFFQTSTTTTVIEDNISNMSILSTGEESPAEGKTDKKYLPKKLKNTQSDLDGPYWQVSSSSTRIRSKGQAKKEPPKEKPNSYIINEYPDDSPINEYPDSPIHEEENTMENTDFDTLDDDIPDILTNISSKKTWLGLDGIYWIHDPNKPRIRTKPVYWQPESFYRKTPQKKREYSPEELEIIEERKMKYKMIMKIQREKDLEKRRLRIEKVEREFRGTEIIKGLYIGSKYSAGNGEWLGNRITHVLNCTKEIKNFFPSHLQYKNIKVQDSVEEKIDSYFDEACQFIHNVITKENGAILVHCNQGRSRAASFILAYFLKCLNWTLERSYHFVLERRNPLSLNNGFKKILMDLEMSLFNQISINLFTV